MKGNNILGIVFSNTHDGLLPELTDHRALGSVPFGCRYRLIDFALSSMVNAGINKVGVVTKNNYRSLMDHLETGKSWDLARKRGGLFMLPPYVNSPTGVYKGKIDALYGIRTFISHSKEEYVLLCDADVVCNIDLEDLIETHLQKGAQITVAYKKSSPVKDEYGCTLLEMESDDKITGVNVSSTAIGEFNVSLDIIFMRRDLLLSLIDDAASHNYTNFALDVLKRQRKTLDMYGYKVSGFSAVIDSMQSYYEANMALLDKEVREMLFVKDRPVYTKLRDDMPSRYGLGSKVENSLIADGCIIDGEVKNCLIFRGVTIGKGAKVSNSIIMQSSVIGDHSQLSYVVTDKNVVINEGRTLIGFKSFPVFINKGVNV